MDPRILKFVNFLRCIGEKIGEDGKNWGAIGEGKGRVVAKMDLAGGGHE